MGDKTKGFCQPPFLRICAGEGKGIKESRRVLRDERRDKKRGKAACDLGRLFLTTKV